MIALPMFVVFWLEQRMLFDKLQVVPLLPELHVVSMVHVDICAACEQAVHGS
jgi:hypothetical protein